MLLLAPPAGAVDDGARPQQQTQQKRRPAPPPRDEVGGYNISFFGGTQLTGSSSGQVGGSLSYFFKPHGRVGIESEFGITFGTDGRVYHGTGNLVLQAGSRTSRFAPYVTAGVVVARATLSLPTELTDKLGELGISLPTDSETDFGFNYGLGIRYYLKDKTSIRGDYRIFKLSGSGGGTFALKRIAVMLSFDF